MSYTEFSTARNPAAGRPVGRVVFETLNGGSAIDSAGAWVNLPRLARPGRDLYIDWTRPDETGDFFAMRRAILTEAG